MLNVLYFGRYRAAIRLSFSGHWTSWSLRPETNDPDNGPAQTATKDSVALVPLLQRMASHVAAGLLRASDPSHAAGLIHSTVSLRAEGGHNTQKPSQGTPDGDDSKHEEKGAAALAIPTYLVWDMHVT